MWMLPSGVGWAERYLTVEEAIEAAFPGAQVAREQDHEAVWYVARREGQVQGYGTVIQEIGKHLPIDFFVALDATGRRVKQVIVLEFRESRGSEVKRRRFLRQFEGKTLRDSIHVGKDIVNISGATLSCEAATIAVRRALQLWEARTSSLWQ